jgi:hypothetical protein
MGISPIRARTGYKRSPACLRAHSALQSWATRRKIRCDLRRVERRAGGGGERRTGEGEEERLEKREAPSYSGTTV